jgi:hypothetical protein
MATGCFPSSLRVRSCSEALSYRCGPRRATFAGSRALAVAEHERSFGRDEAVLDPVPFIDLLSFKHRAVVRAEVFRQRSLSSTSRKLLAGYVESDPAKAGKRFMRVIALLEPWPLW